MSESNKPEIITFQMKYDEFYYLGKEYFGTGYSLATANWGALYDDFGNSGGWDMVSEYHMKPYSVMSGIFHQNNPEHEIYHLGTFTKKTDQIPDGFILVKYPACEYFVITTNWLPEHDDIYNKGAHGLCLHYMDNTMQIPEEYERYGGPNQKIIRIEAENCDDENGYRFEIWIPIKKK